MNKLRAEIRAVADLDDPSQQALFALYGRYYGGTSEAMFREDLAQKDQVLLLWNGTRALRGFSTLAMYERRFEGQALRVMYSGDTIIDEACWGQQALAFSWLQFAGQVKAQAPSVPHYWFLIVKGHRTYRYLSVFSRLFYPAPGRAMPRREKALMDTLARERFGEAYDSQRGVIHFPSSRGHLRRRWAEIPSKDLHRPEVRFFLERNPGYVNGDELVCLCELTPENLKPLARRIFCQGLAEASH